MNDIAVAGLLIASLFLILGSGVWIAMTLAVVGWVGQALSSPAPAGQGLSRPSGARPRLGRWPRCRCSSGWARSCFAPGCREEMFEGLAPWLQPLPGRLMHTNILGCGVFGSVSGSSAATCATIAKVALPELKRRGYDEKLARLAGHRRHAGHPDPALDHHGGLRGGGRRVDHPQSSSPASCPA